MGDLGEYVRINWGNGPHGIRLRSRQRPGDYSSSNSLTLNSPNLATAVPLLHTVRGVLLDDLTINNNVHTTANLDLDELDDLGKNIVKKETRKSIPKKKRRPVTKVTKPRTKPISRRIAESTKKASAVAKSNNVRVKSRRNNSNGRQIQRRNIRKNVPPKARAISNSKPNNKLTQSGNRAMNDRIMTILKSQGFSLQNGVWKRDRRQ